MSLLPVPGLDGAGLALLAGAAAVGGLVRGFAGFGSALVFMPMAGIVLPPFAAITTLAAMDLIGTLPNARRALRDGAPREVGLMSLGFLLVLPLGLALLSRVPAAAFRIGISAVALVMLGLLVAGWRHAWRAGPRGLVGIGALCGFLGGSTGVPGPPAILFLMTGPRAASEVRAHLVLFLMVVDAGMLATLTLMGQIVPGAIVLGAVLLVPFTLASLAGAAMFQPERERIYRRIAWLVILGSALAGLPIWEG
ncbi:sulfite exporter TauE/SafE family protein [Acidimangrovimonas sediminis]|uniref:sulfite exporter TauE/SafE family protein n=1 Tax=Acidimangrovimonas sediminis TaxID=2056283 RepID=UPI001304A970|nr:sulfite exporter TauE/SafE family protein [Acidimangrovimonas sediminis]